MYYGTFLQIDCRASKEEEKEETTEVEDPDYEEEEEEEGDEGHVPLLPVPGRLSACDRTLSAREFVLQSPNYPFPYPPDLDCTTVVERAGPDVCSVEMRFDEFRVSSCIVIKQSSRALQPGNGLLKIFFF